MGNNIEAAELLKEEKYEEAKAIYIDLGDIEKINFCNYHIDFHKAKKYLLTNKPSKARFLFKKLKKSKYRKLIDLNDGIKISTQLIHFSAGQKFNEMGDEYLSNKRYYRAMTFYEKSKRKVEWLIDNYHKNVNSNLGLEIKLDLLKKELTELELKFKKAKAGYYYNKGKDLYESLDRDNLEISDLLKIKKALFNARKISPNNKNVKVAINSFVALTDEHADNLLLEANQLKKLLFNDYRNSFFWVKVRKVKKLFRQSLKLRPSGIALENWKDFEKSLKQLLKDKKIEPDTEDRLIESDDLFTTAMPLQDSESDFSININVDFPEEFNSEKMGMTSDFKIDMTNANLSKWDQKIEEAIERFLKIKASKK